MADQSCLNLRVHSAHPATNMNRDLNKYLKLQTALVNEKAKLEARLNAINKVLGEQVSAIAPAPATRGGKRTFSEATKAKMRAAQKARWARVNAAKAKTDK